jgi:hypothetical protein
MSKVLKVKESLTRKPDTTKAKSILERLKPLNELYVSKEDSIKLKELFKKNLPSGWKATYSVSPWYGFVVTVNTLPVKDAQDLAYSTPEQYRKEVIIGSRKWDIHPLRQEDLDLDKKVMTKQFKLQFNPVGGDLKNDIAKRLDDLKDTLNPKSKTAEKIAKLVVEALKDGYNRTDSYRDIFDQTYGITFVFGDEYKNKFVKLS